MEFRKLENVRADRRQEFVTVCIGCEKLHNKNGAWVTLAEPLESGPYLAVSHGLCPACASEKYPEYFPPAESGRKDASRP